MENQQTDKDVTGTEENQEFEQNTGRPGMENPEGMGGTDISGEDSVVPEPDKADASLPSDGPVSETEGDNRRPDLYDIKKNQDDEPGVPDQDF